MEQQAATSEVLDVISSSPGELEQVFLAILRRATHICDAKFGFVHRYDGQLFYPTAQVGAPDELLEFHKRRGSFRPETGSLLDRIIRTKQTSYSSDIAAETFPVAAAKVAGARSTVAVPMVKDDELVGAIVIYRLQVRPFTDRQIALVQNFAAQAVIAIENARLLNELREALEQQRATAEVLEVISSSLGELEPVFERALKSAVRICGAKFGNLWLREGELFRIAATYGAPLPYVDFLRREQVFRPDPRLGLGQIVRTKQTFQIADIAVVPSHTDGMRQATIELADARTLIGVPMLKDDQVIGAIGIYRQEVRPFTDKQIALVQNFAAQAVIAIENARLLNELRQRTTDLTERTADLTKALEQQTAASEVLQVISSSPGDVEPVFAAMLASATRICEAKFGNLFLREGKTFRAVAWHGEPTYVENWRREPLIIKTDNPQIPLARLVETKQRVHVADLRQEAGYKAGFAPLVTLVDRGGARSLLIVPMLKEHTLVGAIAIYRQDVRPFADKQIALVENFAAQAVIAIENVRLLNELRQSLEQQTATAEVLKVVSSLPDDLEPVFAAMLERAVRICDAKFGNIYRWDGEVLNAVASRGTPSAFVDARQRISLRPGPKDPVGVMIATKKAVHTLDLAASASYAEGEPLAVAAVELGGVRTLLAVPMLKENELTGAFTLNRQEVRPFTDKEIALVTGFAA